MGNCDDIFWKLIQVTTSLLALVVVFANVRFGVRNKQSDLIIHFHKQFDELQKKRAEIQFSQIDDLQEGGWTKQRLEIESAMFFDRFWSLQFDEFLAWYEGYVPTRLYVYWVFARWRELHKSIPDPEWVLGAKTMDSSLRELKERWQNNPDRASGHSMHVTNFLGLMYALKQEPVTVNVDELLRKFGPRPIIRLSRRLFGAY